MLHIRLRLIEICDNPPLSPFHPPSHRNRMWGPRPNPNHGGIVVCQQRYGANYLCPAVLHSSFLSRELRPCAVVRCMRLKTVNCRDSACCAYSESSACPSTSSRELFIRSAVPRARCRAIQFIFRSQDLAPVQAPAPAPVPVPAPAPAPNSSSADFLQFQLQFRLQLHLQP